MVPPPSLKHLEGVTVQRSTDRISDLLQILLSERRTDFPACQLVLGVLGLCL